MSDNVHNPAHYTAGGIETIDFIRAKLGPDGFRAYCLGNVLKYVTRHALKNGDEDLHKAGVYLDWAIGEGVAYTIPTPPESDFVRVPVVADPSEYAPPGVPFDAEEPPLRAGTASKPDDLL
jgi:hypothetical protein